MWRTQQLIAGTNYSVPADDIAYCTNYSVPADDIAYFVCDSSNSADEDKLLNSHSL